MSGYRWLALNGWEVQRLKAQLSGDVEVDLDVGDPKVGDVVDAAQERIGYTASMKSDATRADSGVWTR